MNQLSCACFMMTGNVPRAAEFPVMKKQAIDCIVQGKVKGRAISPRGCQTSEDLIFKLSFIAPRTRIKMRREMEKAFICGRTRFLIRNSFHKNALLAWRT